MDSKEINKVKNYLQMAMDCMDKYGSGDAADDAETDTVEETGDSNDSGSAMTGLKMSLSKYK